MIKENLPIYIKRTVITFIIVLAAILQNTPGVLPKLFSAEAMLLIPVTVSVAMFENEIVSMVFGLVAGLLWDAVSVEGQHFHSVILCVSAFFISMLIRQRVRNTLFSSMILTFAVTLVHNTVYWLIFVLASSPEGAGGAYLRFYFLSCFYTAVAGVAVYLVIRPVEKAFRV